MEQARPALLSTGFHQTAKYLLVLFIGILLLGTLQLGISTVSSWWLLSEVDISYVYGSSAALNETRDYYADFHRVISQTPDLPMKRVQDCFSGKTVVFLGDSTLQESFVDILVKLSGVTDDEVIRAYLLHLFQSYFHREWARNLTISQPGPIETGQWTAYDDVNSTVFGRVDETFGAVNITMLPFHRNLAVTIRETGTRLVFRFIGHYYLRANHAGIQTLADPRFEKELRHYIREADLIVLSTFAHNGYTGHDEREKEEFLEQYTKIVMRTVRRIRNNGVGVVYRGPNVRSNGMYLGNRLDPLVLAEMERRIRTSCMADGIPYVDYRPIIEPFYRTGMCGWALNCHDGNGHMGVIPWTYNSTGTLLLSRTATARLLSTVCSELRPAKRAPHDTEIVY